MNAPGRRAQPASQIEGHYYQHLIAWSEALNALRPNSDATGITVEHPDAGNVDDIVIHRSAGPHCYIQAKHAVDAATPVGCKWLMEKRTNKPSSLSLLQKLHRSWHDLTKDGERPDLRLVTDRDIDPGDPVMKKIDRYTGLLVPGIEHSAAAQPRAQWAEHLDITEDELVDFLRSLQMETGRSIRSEKETRRDAYVRRRSQRRPASTRLGRRPGKGLGAERRPHARSRRRARMGATACGPTSRAGCRGNHRRHRLRPPPRRRSRAHQLCRRLPRRRPLQPQATARPGPMGPASKQRSKTWREDCEAKECGES